MIYNVYNRVHICFIVTPTATHNIKFIVRELSNTEFKTLAEFKSFLVAAVKL